MLEAVGRTKLRDLVAKQLKQFILDSGLKPGDRLPTETELASTFGVSRLSLREATKSLEYLGIVEAKPGRGLFVGSVNLDHVAECVGFHPSLQTAPPLELIGARVVLETGTLSYVSDQMQKDASIYERLNEINKQLWETSDLQRFVDLDIQFHRELILSSGLSPLVPIADILSVFFQRFRKSVQQAEWGPGIQQHQTVIDALRDGNVPLAVDQLRDHIETHKFRLNSISSVEEATESS